METLARRPATQPDGPTPDPGPRLRHEPALDGLRGLAVAAVVVFHLGHLRGGFLGVDLFFVLSGYLITSLLVVEHGSRGAVDLSAFWVRRARRLLPALLVMLVGVEVLLATLTAVADRPRFRGDALATLGYVANWQRMSADVSYWDIFSQPSPLDHTWSLAIEEQFYLLWPLAVLGVLGWRLGRRATGSGRVRALGATAALGGAVSLVLLAVTWSPLDTNRAYFGTDTRLGPTLFGAALATVVARRPRRTGPPSAALEVAGVVALAFLGWSVVAVDGQGSWYYRGGLALFAVAALLVIVAVTSGPPGRLARVVSIPPLALLGRISYGVYLWHWPVIVYLTRERAHVGGAALAALRVGITLALALVSYRLIEQPVRRGALRGRVAAVSTAVAVAVVAVAAVVITRGPAVSAGDAGAIAPTDERPHAIFPGPDDIPPGATRVLLVGDSGPIFLGPELVAEAAATGEVAVAMESQLGCSPSLVGGHTRYPDGRVVDRPECHDERREAWAEAVERFDPDVVVYYLANAGGVGEGTIDDEWVSDCDPSFDTHIEDELTDDIEVLGEGGATVAFASSPYVTMFTEDSDAKVDCRNETYRRIAEERVPGTEIVDLHGFLEQERARTGSSLMRDFVHLDHEGAVLVARWLVPQILDLAPAG